jgi:hypothetical protein
VFKDTHGIAMCILVVSTTIILFSSGGLVAGMQALAFPGFGFGGFHTGFGFHRGFGLHHFNFPFGFDFHRGFRLHHFGFPFGFG